MGVLPVSKKEGKQKGKNGFGPRMKNGRGNLKQVKKSKHILLRELMSWTKMRY